LGKINNVDELISKHDLINDLAEKTSFLKLLHKNLEHYNGENIGFSDNALLNDEPVTEEEAIFNNELNEIGENYPETDNEISTEEQEAIFDHQLTEIIESDFHENMVNLAEENQPEADVNFVSDEISDHLQLEEEAVFNNQLNEIDEDEEPENTDQVLSFVDEERILEDSQPENDDDLDENIFDQPVTEEEEVFNDQLNQIAENEILSEEKEVIEDIFEVEQNEDEILIEETETEYQSNEFNHNQEEIITENSNVEAILTEIKKDSEAEIVGEKTDLKAEDSERRKIVEIEKPEAEIDQENLKSDESFENMEAYRQEKKDKISEYQRVKKYSDFV